MFIKKIIPMALLSILLFTACAPAVEPTPTPTPIDLGAYATEVAGTVIAQITQTAAAQPTPTETPTPEPTATPAASPTPLPAATVSSCENAAYVSDVSIPDGASIVAGTEFVKTWEIKNTGTCNWDETFSLIYGYPAGGPFVSATTKVTKVVAPGESYQISLTLKAPDKAGSYSAAWRLANKAGYAFGGFVTLLITVP